MNMQGKPEIVQDLRGGPNPLSTSLTADVLPEANMLCDSKSSNTGVSTNYAHSASGEKKNVSRWYAVRTTYGREKKAYDFIIQHKGIAFWPTIIAEKTIKGEKQYIEVSRIPNLFFIYGTEETVKAFVYDNVNLPFLRFYYKHTHVGAKIILEPLIVPDNQINSLKVICTTNNGSNTFLLQEEVAKYKKGEKVIVKEGTFKGVTGIVARYHGQQRVGLVIDGLLTAITAYVPSAFLERIQ